MGRSKRSSQSETTDENAVVKARYSGRVQERRAEPDENGDAILLERIPLEYVAGAPARDLTMLDWRILSPEVKLEVLRSPLFQVEDAENELKELQKAQDPAGAGSVGQAAPVVEPVTLPAPTEG